MSELDENTPIFAIAMASELAGMHPQTLRQYDRLGLVSPDRTAGKRWRTSCSTGQAAACSPRGSPAT